MAWKGRYASCADAICLAPQATGQLHGVLLVRSPLLLHVSLAASGSHRQGPDDADQLHIAAEAADAIEDWIGPLHSAMTFIERVRPSLVSLAARDVSAQSPTQSPGL